MIVATSEEFTDFAYISLEKNELVLKSKRGAQLDHRKYIPYLGLVSI